MGEIERGGGRDREREAKRYKLDVQSAREIRLREKRKEGKVKGVRYREREWRVGGGRGEKR